MNRQTETPGSEIAKPEVDECDEETNDEGLGEDSRPVAPLAHWAISLGQLVLLALAGLFFLVLCYVPLRGTDLWVHVNYGNWILDHGGLPTEDPFLPFSEGMEVNPHAWLSQVVLASVDRVGGSQALALLFALVVSACYFILARTLFLATRSTSGTTGRGRLLAMLGGLGLALAVGWSRLATIRPEMLAMVCFAVLLWILVRERDSQTRASSAGRPASVASRFGPWIGVPLVMALWANLHGSVVAGLAVLACFAVGGFVDELWRQRSLVAPFQSPGVRRLVWLTELGLLASLVNPQGIDLLIGVLRFGSNPNLSGVLEWQPLAWSGIGGRAVLLSWLLLGVVLRHSRRYVPASDVLLLLAFGGAALQGIRMLGWYAPIVALVVTPHLSELLRKAELRAPWLAGPRWWTVKTPLLTLAAFLGLWVVFAFSPLGTQVLGGPERAPERVFEQTSTPLGVADHLQKAPPEGLLLAPQWWADFLIHEAGRSAAPRRLATLVTSNIHLVPRQVWLDYERISNARAGWRSALDRYRISTVVVDRVVQTRLLLALEQDEQWVEDYRDRQAAVFVRRPADASETEEPSTGAVSSGDAAVDSEPAASRR